MTKTSTKKMLHWLISSILIYKFCHMNDTANMQHFGRMESPIYGSGQFVALWPDIIFCESYVPVDVWLSLKAEKEIRLPNS